MSRKRVADWDILTTSPSSSSSHKRPRIVPKPAHSRPRKKYSKHKDSKVGEDFHSVPYPLTLLPKNSWQALNQGEANGVCSACGKARLASAHQRKLFLVAERLSWELGTVSYAARSKNEEALWACNAELGIFEPAVDDEEVVIGGKRSRVDHFYPYNSEEEVEFIMRLIATAEVLNEVSWALWKSMVGRMMRALREIPADVRSSDITSSSPRRSPRKSGKQAVELLPTPPSSYADQAAASSTDQQQPLTCSTLQDFYSLLDKIERTSPVGARFLEAYADRLHSETCEDCWFESIAVVAEEDEPELHMQTTPRSSHKMSRGIAQDRLPYGATSSQARSNLNGVDARLPREFRTPTRPSGQTTWMSPL